MRTFWRLSTTPRIPNFFNAYLRGKKHHDLRFFVRNRVGALPQLDSPEEVALINYDPEGMDEGVWYLAHLNSEYSNRTASSREDRRLFATRRYKIETVIAKSKHLYSSATITFQPLVAGERVLKFGLLAESASHEGYRPARSESLLLSRRAARRTVHFTQFFLTRHQSAKTNPLTSSTRAIRFWKRPDREVSTSAPAPPGIRT